MPSNRELRSEIEALSEELGVSVSTSGLSNAKLTELLEDLQTKRGDSDGEQSPEPVVEQARLSSLTRAANPVVEGIAAPKAPDPPNADPPVPPATEPVHKTSNNTGRSTGRERYEIGQGKSCSSLRGTLREGDKVKPEYFSGGQKTLDHLVAKGIVIKR